MRHPGLTKEVLLEMLDIWLLEQLPISTWRDGKVVTFRQHREEIRALAERLACFLWVIIAPEQQQELGFKPPYGGPRQK